jgi:hypothetical protein
MALREFFARVNEMDLIGALVILEPGFYRIRHATQTDEE